MSLILSGLEPCPFCGSYNLDFSLRVFGRQRLKSSFHACIHCIDCNCYGRRLIVHSSNNNLTDKEKEDALMKASELWNNRVR